MKLLTKAQRRILERLRDGEGFYPDYEITCSGIQCWIGLDRVHWKSVNALLNIMALSDVSDEGGGARRFSINETGRNILNDESQINVIYQMLRDGGAWTWRDGKLVKM